MIRVPPHRFSGLLALALLGVALPALAQSPDRIHTVQPGDNLYSLAQRYLDDPAQWRALQRHNQVADPRRLVLGSVLRIPAALLRAEPAPAEVLHVAGQARVRGQAAPLAVGARVDEGAHVDVGDDGFVTLRLADGSVVRLAAGTQVQLRELRHAPGSGQGQTELQLERGRVDATAKPQRAKGSRFEVRTPLAVGGVRGTTFGVAVGEGGAFIGDVREGAIQVRSLAAAQEQAMVQAGEGAHLANTPGSRFSVMPLLAAPDLSGLPDVLEDISIIELRWPQDAHASAWQVRIASGDVADGVVRNASFAQPLARFTALDDGDYLLAVRAVDGRGIPGQEAVRRVVVNARPQAPLLREPPSGARPSSPDVVLQCTQGDVQLRYRFQVARDAAFTDLVAQSADLGTCSHTVSVPVPGTYFWRVAAVDRDAKGARDQGPFSAPLSFQRVALPPVPAAPRLRSGDTSTLHIVWGASTGGPWRHQIQVARDAAFAQLVDERQLSEPVYTRAMPPAGTYHVRVRQIAADGLEGRWTDPQRFEVHRHIATTDAQPLTSSDGQPVQPGAR
ncbi:FecR domain-containing protein [Hydrogenophaga sp. BPS33]|uniref:FecR domain-containing protein n=1 Tax=Hydrogenophaga sp. BPS33 TaxID=2651974 RepID=UPI00131FBA80|nr:FecR domain-containing protein [Hydrogenophaga sp. BPS33]QHE87105.1 LysM peptidoglycan-binding domain-containing protein [Hydrogenophaga sp. BPS33]